MGYLEAGMLICFGLAWPINIYKSIRSRSSKGKSLFFLVVIFVGYLFGLANKILYHRDFVMILYCLNLVMVGVDMFLYFCNQRMECR